MAGYAAKQTFPGAASGRESVTPAFRIIPTEINTLKPPTVFAIVNWHCCFLSFYVLVDISVV
jgi:hypothetical protein